ncbi:hypothetical protein KI688_004460 [Linnemannia hyalina]|uniref:Uncharacterized protein n=1 Tax=Linnemannia hyalina TaxID=64524 RepID=A0A9P7XLR4_9FUNG|nr:hypothetical protein KI688_004460 [Linnemannia hyalina]
MSTFDSNAFKTASTATPSATFSYSLHHQLSSRFSINNHSTSIPSFSSISPLSSSLSSIPWNFKTWNPLATPLNLQARSSLYTTSERMPFISHSWTSASFLDVEAVVPNESDPFFEKRDLAQIQKLMVAITTQRLELKKLGCPLKTVLRGFRDPMSDDDMVSDHDNDSDDEDEDGDCKSMGLVDGAASTKLDTTTDADAASDTDHEKKDQVALLNGGEGAGEPKAENVGTVAHGTTNLSKGRGAQSCNCYKVGQGIDKLAQGVLTLKLRCSHAHLHAHFRVNDATIAAMNRIPFPVLEHGYQGPPPSPSSPLVTLSPLAEDKFAPSTTTASSDSVASVAQAPTPQNNGVTLKGSLVVIKLPKTSRTVVMPKGHIPVSILLPPNTLTTAEKNPSLVYEEGVEVEEEGEATGQKRSSISLKSSQDDASSSAKKRR